MLLLLCLAFLLVKLSSISASYPFSIESSLNGSKVRLDWKVDRDQKQVYFRVVLEGRRPRAALIGFSDHGYLPLTDFCLYTPSSRKLEDGWIDKRLTLRRDLHQDCELEYISANSTHFQFTRQFSTCDLRDYRIENGTTNILLAVSHGRGMRNIRSSTGAYEMRHTQLLQEVPEIRKASGAKGWLELEILAKNVSVPSELTTYWCAVVELNEELRRHKHHMVKYEAVITSGNENLVHHMEVFHCQSPTPAYNGNCNDKGKPRESQGCSRVIAAWAMGAGAVVYPDEAGMPIGGEGFVPYLMVEIHYNNVEGRSDYVDRSGVKITYTRRLRKYDAGIMELGLIYSDANSIPPRQAHFPITGLCVADCTQRFPSNGINIFASQLHAHLTGRKLWTSHYRDGVKIGEVNRDNHYSPHWQHIQRLPEPIRVLPVNVIVIMPQPYCVYSKGDVLTTTCIYDTRRRANWTWGGYGIEDEMCVNYLHYYPAANVEVCKSAIDNTTLHTFFSKLGVKDGRLPINEKYQAVEWTKAKILLLKELYHVSEINMACLDHSGRLLPSHPTNWTKIPRPDIPAGLQAEVGSDKEECLAIND